MITGDTIISAVATALHTGMGTDIAKIYKNTPMQGAQTPYIFLHSVQTTMVPLRPNYYRVDYTVDVICHPPTGCDTIQTWCRDISLKITKLLNYIDVEGYKCKCRGYTMNVVDNILHVVCNYDLRAYFDSGVVDPYMQTLDDKYYSKIGGM